MVWSTIEDALFTVSIHSDNSGVPGASLGTLTHPSPLVDDAVNAFTHPGIALDATGWQIVNTSSDNEDLTSATGWSIADGSLVRTWTSSGSWSSIGPSKKMRVNGTAKTGTPATGNPSITGTAQVGMTRTAGPGDIDDADGRMLAVGGGVQVPGPVPGGLLRKALQRGPTAESQTDSGHTLVFPVSAQTSAVRTALALHNPGATVLVVQRAFQTADTVLADVDLTLNADGGETGFVDEWFPEMPESGGAVQVYRREALHGRGCGDGYGQRALLVRVREGPGCPLRRWDRAPPHRVRPVRPQALDRLAVEGQNALISDQHALMGAG